MPARGRPSFLSDRVSTTVSLERDDLARLHEEEIDISVLFRKFVKVTLDGKASPLETMKAEAKTLKESIKTDVQKLKSLNKRIAEEEEKIKSKKEEKLQKEQFEIEREQIFWKKFRPLIFRGAICEVDYYSKVRKELKFKDQWEAKEWLLKYYKIQKDGERKFTADRIKTFLRWDQDISKYW